ncbi:hypothetical protein SNE40_016862 [Patella caerulea]|uniref:Protein quiver n=1 Tax=Patella caerulea TaxID=87958 RepID=A0AAN8JFM8_PATCE
MANFTHLSLFFLVIIALVKTGTAIRCYSCSSLRDDRCGDEFTIPNSDARECQGTCYKYRGDRWSNDVRYVEINRGCRQQTEKACEQVHYNGIEVQACYCNKNYCNSGVNLKFSLVNAAVFFMAFLYKMFF